MNLYFVRHGKTEWNLEGRFQGNKGDSPLLPESKADLEALGQHLSQIHFDTIFSSDLQRAATSAQVIADQQQRKCQIAFSPALREWHLGKLEGSKISLMQYLYPKQHQAFRHNLARFNSKMFGAESVYQATQRLTAFVKGQKECQAQNLLFVSHGAILTASIRSLLGYQVGELRKAGSLDNSSLTILETEDFEHFRLISWNDSSFLTKKNIQKEIS